MTNPTFTPVDPDFETRVRASFGRQEAMKTLGVSVTRIAPGAIEFAMDHRHALTQQHGFIHAGIIATALDSACGYAAFTLMPSDSSVLTVEFKINLLAPAKGERFRFNANVVRAGKSITVCHGEAYALNGDSAKLVATMTGTLMAVFGRDEIRG
ncbi:MAG: PaaI family thioesterase [Sulfurifustis sp.]